MDFDFINEVRLQLENTNIFSYSIRGAKMCALLLLFFSILERWGKNTFNQSSSVNDLLTMLGFMFLIMSSDYMFNTVEAVFSSIDNTMSTSPSNSYTDLMMRINEDYDRLLDGATAWYEIIAIMGANFLFFIGYGLAAVLMGLCKIAEMAMICGFLLTRVFFLEIMKFLFPIAVALSTLKQTSGLIGKWLKLYIGLSLLGIIYIGILKLCDITQTALYNSFSLEDDSFFNAFLNMNSSVWVSLIVIIIIFTLKASLFNKSTSFITNFFSS